MREAPLRRLAAEPCLLGEAPLWDRFGGRYFWSDIERGRIFSWRPDDDTVRLVYTGPAVGGMTLEADGALVLFRVEDLARFEPDTGRLEPRRFADAGSVRFNDVVADPRGRVFAGTIGVGPESGGVFRFDPDGAQRLLFRGTGCSNGMGFSPDERTFYWTCSTTCRLFAFDYELGTGEIGRRRVFYACGPDEGIPDGLCVDRRGVVWSARWAGGCLVGHEPSQGARVARLSLPATRVTAACFGGARLDALLITTAVEPGVPDQGGGTFVTAAAVEGLPRFESRLFCR